MKKVTYPDSKGHECFIIKVDPQMASVNHFKKKWSKDKLGANL